MGKKKSSKKKVGVKPAKPVVDNNNFELMDEVDRFAHERSKISLNGKNNDESESEEVEPVFDLPGDNDSSDLSDAGSDDESESDYPEVSFKGNVLDDEDDEEV
eukprot:Pgem_evm1s1899